MAIALTNADTVPGLVSNPTWGFAATAGRLLILVGWRRDSLDTADPTGWTRLRDNIGGGGFDDSVIVWAKIAAGGETGTSGITWSTSGLTYHVEEWTGLTLADVETDEATATGTAVTFGTVTPPADQTGIVLAVGSANDDNTRTWTPPAGYDVRYNPTTSFHPHPFVATDEIAATDGDPITPTATLSASLLWRGIAIFIGGGSIIPPDPDPEPPEYVPPPPARALVELYLPAEGAARWGEAQWGVAAWSSSEWTDITPQCVSVDVQWGATQPDKGVLAPPEAGKWTVVLHDPDRLLDPSNADSPYYPHVRSLTPIRITTRGFVVRQGHLDFVRHDYAAADEVDREWARPGMLRATDNIALLAAADVPEDTILPDTLWARTAAIVAASGVPVAVSVPRGALLGGDPDLAPWEPGTFRAWQIILASAQEVGYIPYLTNTGTLTFRPWDQPLDRDALISSPELVALAVETADTGLVSAVIVNDEADGEIERRITPVPRYGRRLHRRDLATIDGEAYAERILRAQGVQALRFRPGAIRPDDAAAVEWYARREANEIVTLDHSGAAPDVEVRTRILGGRFYITDLGNRPSWRFYYQTCTEALEPLVADPLPFGTPSNLYLIDDDTGEYLYADGAYSIGG